MHERRGTQCIKKAALPRHCGRSLREPMLAENRKASTGSALNAYHSDGAKRSAYPGQVYLVCVNDDGVAYNWRWEKADPDDLRLPQNHANRFKKKLL